MNKKEEIKKDIDTLSSSFSNLEDEKIEFYQSDLTIKKRRNKNTHLTPKKKKRKKRLN